MHVYISYIHIKREYSFIDLILPLSFLTTDTLKDRPVV